MQTDQGNLEITVMIHNNKTRYISNKQYSHVQD